MIEDNDFYHLAYRVQEAPRYCELDVVELIAIGDTLPHFAQGFRVRHELCKEEAREWRRQGLDRVRRETLDSFRVVTQPSQYYEQFITVEGITVKANSAVRVDSMYFTADIIGGMMRSLREDIQKCLVGVGAALATAPEGEYITHLPEFYPQIGEPEEGAAGLGAVKGQPVSGAHEDEVLRGGSLVVVHEFAHSIQNLCFNQDEHDEWNRFYRKASEANLFPGAYGMTNSDEFFAVFTESYFDRPDEIQWRWDREDDEFTREKLSVGFPEIFSFLKRIYQGWEVGAYFTPDLGLPDRDALVALYNSTNGPNWTNSENWLSDKPLDKWYGVTTGDNRRVSKLELAENGLSGEIPSELGNLANMLKLDLSSNQLTGQIPDELGMINLYTLNLGDNQLSGEIPRKLGNLINLEGLDLSDNLLNGEIPPELARLGKRTLIRLTLWGNRLTGQIPSGLAELPKLNSLRLAGNPLGGCIPDKLRNVQNHDLDWVGLPSCESGELPATDAISLDRDILVAFYNSTGGNNWTNGKYWLSDVPIRYWHGVTVDDHGRVTELRLDENNLTGELPPELGELTELKKLYLWENQLSGGLPPELGNLTNLKGVAIQANRLSGELPPELGNLANLEGLHLWGNRLSGQIPPELADLSNLNSLWLVGNPLSGCIPVGLRDVSDNDLDRLNLPSC